MVSTTLPPKLHPDPRLPAKSPIAEAKSFDLAQLLIILILVGDDDLPRQSCEDRFIAAAGRKVRMKPSLQAAINRFQWIDILHLPKIQTFQDRLSEV